MATYTYTARAVNGDLKSATIEAPNRDEVIKQLKQQRLNVLKIDEGTRDEEEARRARSRCATSSSSPGSSRR